MAYQNMIVNLQYSWEPFMVGGYHLTFSEHVAARLERGQCSCWGPSVYKWEGIVQSGVHAGKRALLVGETGDIRQRIKQYVSGTQERGNKLWRETFLSVSDTRLFTLNLASFSVSGHESIDPSEVFHSNNLRLVLEQLLVMQALVEADNSTWVVNAKQ